jgi:hypothetical protein
MNICANCKSVIYCGPDGPLCGLTKGKQDPVSGGYAYDNCREINKNGKCKEYKKRETLWEDMKTRWWKR